MGLDIVINKTINTDYNEKGHLITTLENVGNLRNTYYVLEKLGRLALGGCLDNCATYSFNSEKLLNVLSQLKEELQENKDNLELKYDVNHFENFIKENNISEENEEFYHFTPNW